MTGNSEMGLKKRTSSLELSLGIGTMLDIFQSVGILPDSIKSETTEGAISSAKVFSIHVEMPSGPAAECVVRLFNMVHTSSDTQSNALLV